MKAGGRLGNSIARLLTKLENGKLVTADLFHNISMSDYEDRFKPAYKVPDIENAVIELKNARFYTQQTKLNNPYLLNMIKTNKLPDDDIILTQTGKNTYGIFDGNHRIAYALLTGKKTIKVTLETGINYEGR